MKFKAYKSSSAQKRLYLVNQLTGDSILYNMPTAWVIEGNLDPLQLERVVQKMIQRHESLRTAFATKDGMVLQKVYDRLDFKLEYREMVHLPETAAYTGLEASIETLVEDFLRPFDLDQVPLWRTQLVQLTSDRQLLLFDIHHIISDGISLDLIIHELAALYAGQELPPLEFQYVDFTLWQNDLLESEKCRQQETYWLRVFEGEIPVLNIPTDYPRPLRPLVSGRTIEFEIKNPWAARLNQLAAANNTTLYVVLLAAFTLLISKYTGQEDIVVGTPITGRTHREFEKIIGMFVNTLAMRNQVSTTRTAEEFLMQVSKNTFDAFENQDYQFEMLVEQLVPQRQVNRNPLFDAMLVLQNFSQGLETRDPQNQTLKITRYPIQEKVAKFDLTLFVFETVLGLFFQLQYRESLFHKTTMDGFIRHFTKILQTMAETPEITISDIQLLFEEEKEHILFTLNSTEKPYPRDKTIHQLFEEQVEKTPNHIAVVGVAGQPLPYRTYMAHMTYKELNKKSNQLALLLRQKGVRPDTVVGVMEESTIDRIIWILGILKAGGAYLPIDTQYPENKILSILYEGGASFLLTRETLVRHLGFTSLTSINEDKTQLMPLNREIIRWEEVSESVAEYPFENPEHVNQSSDLLYIIATSGSTGKPKSVMLEHRNLVNLLYFQYNCTYINFSRKVLQFASIGFDVSAQEIFSALLTGGQLYLINKELKHHVPQLFEFIRQNSIEILFLPPAFLKYVFSQPEFAANFPGSVAHIIAAGEQLVISKAFGEYLRKKSVYLHNHYGPTETHVVTTFTMAPFEKIVETPPIGRPISNTKILILDRTGKYIQPVGVPGELYISGANVGRGYYNREDLTNERFTENPFVERERMYRTGDLARWRWDGCIEFLGRMDDQLKIRGFRVEPGEIEGQLLKYKGIKDAVVVEHKTKDEEKYLCAYIVPEEAVEVPEIKNMLSKDLPAYMVPSYILSLEKIPLTPNGKVDRRSLPVPDERFDGKYTYTAPANKTQEQVVAIFSKALGIAPNSISINADFFELGGHSLKATLLISEIHKVFDVKIPLGQIFKTPTAEGLSQYIEESGTEKYLSINPVEKREYYALSSAQKRLYLLQQMDPQSTGYHLPVVVELEGELDKDKAENIFIQLIKRHEAFRTSFESIHHEPVQKIHDEVAFEIENHSSQMINKGQLVLSMTKDFIRPFNLSQTPLLRVGMIRLEEKRHILLVDMHHIVSDGTSLANVVREFMECCQGKPLEPFKIQYKDYALWQKDQEENKTIKRQEGYWLKEFEEEIPLLNLPTDFIRPVVQDFDGHTISFEVGTEETRALKKLVSEEGATLFMVLLAIFNVLLSKLSGDEDIVVGIPIAGRPQVELQPVMGMFVNTLALRSRFTGEKTFRHFLKEVKERTLAAFENQDYPFEVLVTKAAVRRDTSRNPLFDVLFSMQNIDIPGMEIPGLKLKPLQFGNRVSKFDLSLDAAELEEKLVFTFENAVKLFRKETIERFTRYFKTLVSSVNKNPGKRVGELEIIPDEEKKEILVDFNDTCADYPKDKTIHQLFEQQVERTPNHIAVVGVAGQSLTYRTYMTYMTYKELNKKSNQLAWVLWEKGVEPGNIVGLMVDRSIEMIVGIMGILKADAAYLPIDPEYPEERIRYMLVDSDIAVLLTNFYPSTSCPSWLYSSNCQLSIANCQLSMSSPKAPIHHSSFINHHSTLAYIIYTSGTSGRPKGVMVEHRSVLNLLTWFGKTYHLQEDTHLLQLTDCTFDPSVEDIFGSLIHGAALYVAGKELVMDREAFRRFIQDNHIHIVDYVPPVLDEMLGTGERLESLRVIISGGMPLEKAVKDRLMEKGYTLHNNYGPTEITVDALSGQCSEGKVTLGRPISNMKCYIFDRHIHLVPIGVPGELWVAGHGVARGYLNNPELTAEKFDQDFQDSQDDQDENKKAEGSHHSSLITHHSALYRTGDLARWLPHGEIEFLGRIDDQVKIRGYRIEPGEIKNRLSTHEAVKEAVVVANVSESQGNETYLIAYVVPYSPHSPRTLDTNELKKYLACSLPDYMIPSFFIPVEKIPLTPNGKIDRKALPQPEIGTREAYAAPRNEMEKKLVEIWSDVLMVQSHAPVGIDENFFALGGHSLKASIVISRIHKTLHVKVPFIEIFKNPTVRALSHFIVNQEKEIHCSIEPVEEREYYPQSSAQKRLFFLDRFEDIGSSYNMPAVLKIAGKIDHHQYENAFNVLIQRHENLRTSFHLIDGNPVQKIQKMVEFRIDFYDLNKKFLEVRTGEPFFKKVPGRRRQSQKIPTSIMENFVRPFDLSKAPLLRVGLVTLSEAEHLLLFDMHHIISDGTSIEILTDEFITLFSGEKLAPLRIQYKDFTLWKNQLFETGRIKKQEEHWLNLYSDCDAIPRLNVPLDYPRPPVFTFEGDQYEFKLGPEETSRFKQLVSQCNATLYMNLLTAFNVLLYKYTLQEDIIVGSGILGRPHADLQAIIGMFVNTLALRNSPEPGKTYRAFLNKVKKTSLSAYENQDVPFEELVDQLNPPRDPSRNPIFDVNLVVQNFEQAKKEFKDVAFVPFRFDNKTAKFDLTLFAGEVGDDICFSLEYYTPVFKPETIQHLALHFVTIIQQVNQNPDIAISDIDMLTPQERELLLYEFNRTDVSYPNDRTIHQLFEEQAVKTPGNIAAIGRGWHTQPADIDISITYDELNQKANQIANYLFYEKDIQPNDRVGILLDSSLFQVEAILGVLKAGAAYVPISPALPEERIKEMIDDAGIAVIISRKKYVRLLNRLQWECVTFFSYLCMDSWDIHAEEEQEKSRLMDKKIWDYVGETAVDEITGGGWTSSYTGEPFSREEMDEYGNNTLEKLRPLLHKDTRILEIGCASGITMYRLAPMVGFYYGTDLSRVIIQKNKERVQAEGFQNITLDCLAAHEIERIKDQTFDIIILNSVIQAFHGHNYLRQVIQKAIHLLNSKGYLLIGDVMDLELKEALIRDLKTFKQAEKDNNYKTKTDLSEELFVSRGFFEDLKVEIPVIQSIQYSQKIHTIENELTRFRYDALFTIDKGQKAEKNGGTKRKFQHDLTHLERYSILQVPSFVTPCDLAYIIYTSGSTGKPKGVMVEHQGVVNTLLCRKTEYKMGPEDTSLQLFSYAFDGFVTAFFTPILSGARVVLPDEAQVKDITQIKEIIVKHKVTHFISIPQFFRAIIQSLNKEEAAGLKTITLAGDKLSSQIAEITKRKNERIEIANEYGVTEGAVMSTLYRHQGRDVTVKIGRPIWNTTIHILDRHGKNRLQPVGVPGELCIAGAGVARGYLNNPELTAEKFDQDFQDDQDDHDEKEKAEGSHHSSFITHHSALYRTGDLARWLHDGTIEFFGRIDHQVKIRGYRIELGEIENRLLNHEEIKDAVVITRGEGNEDIYLCAYIVPHSPATLNSMELKKYLSRWMPDYMIPSYFVCLDEIPVTPHGKIDRRALPEPAVVGEKEDYAPSRNRIEEKLVEIWEEVLMVKSHVSIGIDDNFFDLGGHSLKAAALVSLIQKAFDVEFPLSSVFKDPTIRAIGEYISGAKKSMYESIQLVEKRDFYPQSSAQRRLFFINQFESIGIGYNMPLILKVDGKLDKKRFEKSFKELVECHESLRTSFHMIEDQPIQRIHKDVDFNIDFYGLNKKGVAPLTSVIRDFIRPFDLSKAPLLRMGLVKLSELEHLLLFDNHHIIGDGTSMGLLTDEFTRAYSDSEEALSPQKIQYKDFALWQNQLKLMESGQIKRQEAYWLKLYSDIREIPRLELSYDYSRPKIMSFEGHSDMFELGSQHTKALKEMARATSTTLYMNLLALLNILLYKYTGQEDIIIGSVVAGRPHSDLHRIIGLFVNTLPMRNYPHGKKPWHAFIQEIKENTLSAFENQDLQLEDLVEKLDLERDTSRNPLFDVCLVFQNFEISRTEMKDVAFALYPYENETSKFDITFSVFEAEDDLGFHLEFCTKLFRPETIQRLMLHFVNIVKAIHHNPNILLSDIEIMSEEEKQQLIEDFNNTAASYPRARTIHQLFEEQVEKTPDNLAIVGVVAQHLTNRAYMTYMTYKELDKKSSQLAWVLREKGLQPGCIVGLMGERSIEMIIGIMGILKAGGAYLPIEPDCPEARIQYLLNDSKAKVLITAGPISTNVSVGTNIDSCRDAIYRVRETAQGLKHISTDRKQSGRDKSHPYMIDAQSLAYVIYTSGTTGNPKGVMVEHRNVVRLVMNTNYVHLKEEDRLLQTGALEFDASTFEIWGTLLNGAQLYLVNKEDILSPETLKQVMKKNKITTLWLTSPLFNQMVQADVEIFAPLKNLLVGGDVLSPPHINKVRNRFPDLKVINGYGPTENTTFSTTFTIEKEYQESIPIGKPISNSTTYIIDTYNYFQPIGVVGELVVGGDGVARGYLNNPELTAEKFDRDLQDYQDDQDEKERKKGSHHSSFITHHSALYRTGDLARWLPDGNIQFIGRRDSQVKIRGFRVELGEIENRLLKHKAIKEAVVTARKADFYGRGENRLCAYIVPYTGLTVSEIKDHLSEELPEYMLPSYFVMLDSIPLTPNGKVDYRALPAPEIETKETVTAPRNKVEEKLVDIWSEVLFGRDEWHASFSFSLHESPDQSPPSRSIGINDNFFELGGHSLTAIRLISRIHQELKIKLPLEELFKTPFIKGLALYIMGAEEDRYASIERAEKKEFYSLSSAQKRLYILHRMGTRNTGYNIPTVLEFDAALKRKKMEGTFKKLIQRHESLRTSFHMIDGESVQCIHNENKVEFEIEFSDLTVNNTQVEIEGRGPSPSTSSEKQSAASIIKHFIRPFDLSRAPLLRIGLLKSGEGKHILMVDMHHIISDGTSMEILVREFIALHEEIHLSPLKLQYKDYAEWQNSRKERKTIKSKEMYWLKVFEGEIPLLDLPFDYPRPSVQSFEGGAVNFRIGSEAKQALKQWALEHHVTLYMVLLGIYNILLSRLSGKEDIVIGTPTAGRRHADLQKIIGMFVNTLALRNYPLGEKTFETFINEVKERTLDAFENQEYPFEDLVEKVSVPRDTGRNPLFDVLFTMNNPAVPGENPPASGSLQTLRPYEHDYKVSKFDLTLRIDESGENLDFILEYCTKLFKKETVERFSGYYMRIVSAVLENPEEKIGQLEILSEEEKYRVLDVFNRTQAEFPAGKTFHELFEEQVEKTPDNLAVVGIGGQHLTYRTYMTYEELNEKSNQLAHELTEKGVKPGDIVGIMLEPSIEMIIGIIGILKSGAAYLPIDPDYPEERIRYMLADSNIAVLLTNFYPSTSCPSWLYSSNCQLSIVNCQLSLSSPKAPIHHSSNQFITHHSAPAYIIYTSGTTGKPKGVLVKHENLVNYVHWFADSVELTGRDKSILTSSFAFDLCYTSLYPSILNGCELHVVSKEVYLNAERLLNYIRVHEITYIKVTPSLFSLVVNSPEFTGEICRTLRLIVLGGEAIILEDVEKAAALCSSVRIMNHYGPTEATIGSIARFIDFERFEEYRQHPIIGKPINNTRAYILDRNRKSVPIGVPGELFISGTCLARGYLNNPELTAEKFDQDFRDYQDYQDEKEKAEGSHHSSFIAHHSALYRTGDLARWLPNGNIEFLGRVDTQVKIRGFRIETSEIKNQLLKHEGIADTVVTVETDQTGDKYLCAYIVPDGTRGAWGMEHGKEAPAVPAKELREFLSITLPDYMIPSHFVYIEKIPLTPNNKIDRKALPAPDASTATAAAEDGVYAAPDTLVEKKLTAICCHLFNVEKIGIEDDLFVLGGNSLKIIRLASEIYKEFKAEIPILYLFKNPRPREISKYILQNKFINQEEEAVILLNEIKPEKIFCFPPAVGYGIAYMELSMALDGYSIYAFNYIDDEDKIERYADEILNIQPQGPYRLLAYSAGGKLCLKTAEKLEERGYEVSDIILLDCHRAEINLSDEEFEASYKILLEDVERNMEYLQVEFLKERVMDRMKKYALYNKIIEPFEVLDTTIHQVKSPETKEIKEKVDWGDLTRKECINYEGYGVHRTMLTPGHLEKNVAIIRSILKKQNPAPNY